MALAPIVSPSHSPAPASALLNRAWICDPLLDELVRPLVLPNPANTSACNDVKGIASITRSLSLRSSFPEPENEMLSAWKTELPLGLIVIEPALLTPANRCDPPLNVTLAPAETFRFR